MKRIRLSTLLLLIVIAALSIDVMMQRNRNARLSNELEARRAEAEVVTAANMKIMRQMEEAKLRAATDQAKAAAGADR